MALKDICLCLVLISTVVQLNSAIKQSKMKKILKRFSALQGIHTPSVKVDRIDKINSLSDGQDKLTGIDEKLNQLDEVNKKINSLTDGQEKLDELSQILKKLDDLEGVFGIKEEQASCAPVSDGRWIDGGHKTNKTYSNIIPAVIKNNKQKVLATSYNARTMSVVNGHIWMCDRYYGMIVLVDLSFSKKIKFTYMNSVVFPLTIRQSNFKDVLMGSKQGLFVIDFNGVILSKIGDGLFSQVAVDCNKAYAYNESSSRVVVLAHINGNWVVDSSFPALNGRLEVTHNIIYISANQAIHAYSPTGTLINIYGKSGTTLGKFNNPFVVGVDSEGALLIADERNNRIQVMSPGGRIWQQYIIPGIVHPFDVIVDSMGNLWVLWQGGRRNRFQISEFSA